MPVSGRYLARRVRQSVAAYVRSYMSVVQADVLPAFRDLNERASKVRDDEFRRLCALPATSDDGDASEQAEQAQEAGLVFYRTMTELRHATLALYTVGLFHLLEQHLRDICEDASFGVSAPTDTKLEKVSHWYLLHFKLDLEKLPSWQAMETLRLLANTAKHGAGSSEKQLRQRRPELFEDRGLRRHFPDMPDLYTSQQTRLPLVGRDLFLSEEVFAEIGASALRFAEEIAVKFEGQSEPFFAEPN